MTLKKSLLTLSTLLLLGCNSNTPTPSSSSSEHKAFRHSSGNTKTKAILKLDTKGHTAIINDIIVTKSKDIISASDDKTIRVWDSTTGVEKRKILGEIGAGSEGKIYAMALSPNEKFLAVGGFFNNPNDVIRIYNYQSGRLIKILKSHTNIVNDLSFSSDGKYLISGSGDNTAKIWNSEINFRLVDTISFHSKQVYAVKIIKSSSDYFAVTAGYDNRIALYNMQTKKIVNSHQLDYKLKYLATSKENIAVCGVNGNKIQIYDFNLNPIKTILSEAKPNGLAYTPNGKLLISGTAKSPFNVNLYSVNQNYQKIQSFKKHTNTTMAVAFLDNQTAVSGGGNNNEIYIWNVATNNIEQQIEGVGNSIWSIGIKGDKIAWGTQPLNRHQMKNHIGQLQKSINLKSFKIDNASNSKEFNRITTNNQTYSLSYRKGGDYGYTNAILDIKKNNQLLKSILRGSTEGYRHNTYGFYKNYIVSGGMNGHLKIYDLVGKEVANLVGHTSEIWSIAIDGDRLVSGSLDQTIKVWDLSKLKQTMQPQLSLFVSKDNEWVAWTPQGFYNASKGAEQYIGYHINQGANKEAKFLDVSRFRKQFYRPDLVAKAINGEDVSHYAQGIDVDSLLNASGGLPPQVEILTASHSTSQDATTIGVKVCDAGAGFENLTFYVDDKPIKYLSQSKAFRKRKEQVGNCSVIEQSIAVPSGRHSIGFNATNKEGSILSNTPSITVTNTQVAQRKPNLHLLTLSINDYKDDSLDLKFPNNDADKLAEKLKSIGKAVFGSVQTYALKDSQVTQQQIDVKVAQIAKNIKADDVFVLYISGHGVTNDADGDYYFIPYDCPNGADVQKRAINQSQFKKIMSQISAVKSAILLDTCQSGSMASQDLVITSVNRFGGNVGSAIIAGASSKQDAIDGYKEHGIFTYTLLDAMNNKKVYDFEDRISIGDIAQYVKKVLPRLAKKEFGHRQEPTIYMNGDTTFSLGGL